MNPARQQPLDGGCPGNRRRSSIDRQAIVVGGCGKPAGRSTGVPGFWAARLGCDFGSVTAAGRGGCSGASAQRAGHIVVDVDQLALGIRFEPRDGLGGRVDHNCEMSVDGVGHRTPRRGLGRRAHRTGRLDIVVDQAVQRARATLVDPAADQPWGLPPASDRGRPLRPPVGTQSPPARCARRGSYLGRDRSRTATGRNSSGDRPDSILPVASPLCLIRHDQPGHGTPEH